MKIFHRLAVCLLIIAFSLDASAEKSPEGQKESKIQIFTKDPYVRTVFKDKAENIWIAGSKEIVKVGAESVTRYSDGFPAYVSEMAEDAAGNIWVATTNKIAKFDGKTWSEISMPVKLSSPADGITSMINDSQGNIWLATNETLSRFDGKKWYKIDVEKKSKYDSRQFKSMAFDSHGNLWIAPVILGKIHKYDGKKLTELDWKLEESSYKFTEFIYITPSDQIFIGTSTAYQTQGKPTVIDGLYRFTGKGFKSYLKNEKIYSMWRTADADYYVTTEKGVYYNFALISEKADNDLIVMANNKTWYIGKSSNIMKTGVYINYELRFEE